MKMLLLILAVILAVAYIPATWNTGRAIRRMEAKLRALEESRMRAEAVTAAQDRVREWIERYPNVSFWHSRHARELLHNLYHAELRRAGDSSCMDPFILAYIYSLLELSPDDDPPPFIAGPTWDPLFCYAQKAASWAAFCARIAT
jgi:hypothetical protein